MKEDNVKDLVVDQPVESGTSSASVMRRVENTGNSLIEMALSGNSDIAVIERLVDLQNMQNDREAKRLFNAAMSRFQGSLKTIEKLGVVDYTSSKGRTYYTHARIEDIAKAIREPLNNNGLSYRFSQKSEGDLITVGCTISHEFGHSEYTEFSGYIDTSGGKDKLKGSASTITYLRRYVLTGAFGIVVGGEDEEHQVEASPESDRYLSEQMFSQQSGIWIESIKSGKKTSGEVISYVEGKGFKLSDSQRLTLNKVVSEK